MSVIIPAHNAAETIGQQLEALRLQVYPGDWEIVVVDNGSTDNTVSVVKNYQTIVPQLRLCQASEKIGAGYARNIGAQTAIGDVLLFCDADDVVAPGWVSALSRAVEEHSLVAGAVEVQALNSAERQNSFIATGTQSLGADFLPYVMGGNLGISREAFEAVGGFAEDLPRAQDVDFSWRLQLQGYKIHDEPGAVVYYRPRKNVREIWKTHALIGESEVNLYKRFKAHGMLRRTGRETRQTYKWLLKRIPKLMRMQPEGRMKWFRTAALSWGRLRASLRLKTWYL